MSKGTPIPPVIRMKWNDVVTTYPAFGAWVEINRGPIGEMVTATQYTQWRDDYMNMLMGREGLGYTDEGDTEIASE